MATLDELRLQQLLQPFENQNTGVMSTNSALPFINTGQVYQNLQNQDLVDQIIKQNMQKSTGSFINVPQDYYPPTVNELIPLQDLGIDTSYGVASEPDEEQVRYLTEQQPNFFRRMFDRASDIFGSGKELIGQGIGSLANILTGNPIVGGIFSLMSKMKTPMSEYQMRDLQRRGYGDQLSSIYGPGGIMQGYNPVSMFGRGPLESIINRRNKAKSEAAIQKLNQAITQLGGSTDKNLSAYRASRPASERRSTGPAGGGRDNTGGDVGSRGAADRFSNRSGMGRTGY